MACLVGNSGATGHGATLRTVVQSSLKAFEDHVLPLQKGSAQTSARHGEAARMPFYLSAVGSLLALA